MSEHISKKKIAAAVLMPFLLTLLSLSFQQRNDSSIARVNPRGICRYYPDYDLKAGFPLAFLYESDIPGDGGSPPSGYPAGGGPFALLSPDCNHVEAIPLAIDFIFYVGLTIGFGVIRSRMRRSEK
jgi:hypothetical protein